MLGAVDRDVLQTKPSLFLPCVQTSCGGDDDDDDDDDGGNGKNCEYPREERPRKSFAIRRR